MTSYCASANPGEPDLFCNKAVGNHEQHSAFSILCDSYVDWVNDRYVPTERAKSRRNRSILDDIASHIEG
jgi:hypothetical protein